MKCSVVDGRCEAALLQLGSLLLLLIIGNKKMQSDQHLVGVARWVDSAGAQHRHGRREAADCDIVEQHRGPGVDELVGKGGGGMSCAVCSKGNAVT